MAHYAFLDASGTVVEVIVGKDEGSTDWESYYAQKRGLSCKRTSYRTRGGEHPSGTPFRKNYAGVGFQYDSNRDAFIPPKPHPSWTLNEQSCTWEPPVPRPQGSVYWSEATQEWIQIPA
jgi:hypothetical protein